MALPLKLVSSSRSSLDGLLFLPVRVFFLISFFFFFLFVSSYLSFFAFFLFFPLFFLLFNFFSLFGGYRVYSTENNWPPVLSRCLTGSSSATLLLREESHRQQPLCFVTSLSSWLPGIGP